jgi:hypothetical protein
MDKRGYQSALVRLGAISLLLAPAACGNNPGGQAALTGNGLADAGSRAANAASPADQPPAQRQLINGLTPDEAQGITQAVRANVVSRTFSWEGPGWGVQYPCTQVFDVGQAQIVDASLSGQAGRVQVAVPITGQRPYRAPEHFNIQWWYPTQYCYGVRDDGQWTVGRTVNVLFDYNVEHWQSGWRLSANQGQG